MPTPSTIRTLTLPGDRPRQSLDFNTIRLRLASSEEIQHWSYGEVLKPETINYRSQKPERDGLFCQKIFGPVKDWQCACGRYKKIRYRGITCDRCGVEITRSLVRRERMGHIKLAAPVTHIWFLRGVPSKVGLLLDISTQSLEKVVYFANFIITEVKKDLIKEALVNLDQELKDKKKELKDEFKIDSPEYEKELTALTARFNEAKKDIQELKIKTLLSEPAYRELSIRYGHLFEAKIGAEGILDLLKNIDPAKLAKELEKQKTITLNPTKKKKLIKQIKYVKNFVVNNIQPEHMVLQAIPVIPPDLRPLVQLDGGRFASSDLNDLYRRVINRNNRLKKLYDLKAPEVILRNEKRMLQEAVDALIDNDMRSGKTVIASTGQRRPLKSLADILKGKQGRFRQNLLGKRVDYSGRSVIVVGPTLKLHQCGIPKIMAVELFKPSIASELIKREVVHNVRSANRLIDQGTEEVWAILEEIVKHAYVFLNRAPTLHRLSIQAFQPVLIEGKAIQIHPLVCAAFNADFDGDQMAVHVPITARAKKEAGELILSTRNLLKPATGEPVVTPAKDMIWGAYWMTLMDKDKKTDKELKIFASFEEALMAQQLNKISLQERIRVRYKGKIIITSTGRLIFDSILPDRTYDLNYVINKKKLNKMVSQVIEDHGNEIAAQVLDRIKETTFSYLTLSGMSWGMDDLPVLEGKKELIKEAEDKINQIQNQYEIGLLADDERYLKTIEVWLAAKNKVTEMCRQMPPSSSSVISMIESGARGSWAQLTQMFGMRGIVSSPTGKLIELPIKSSFKDGFNVLEYFISTHGSRKGVSDTALRTASAGYLTRRMVDVCQSVIISEEDCQEKNGIKLTQEENKAMNEDWTSRLFGRVLSKDVKDLTGKKVIAKAGVIIDALVASLINEANPTEVWIRSVLTCESKRGVCAKCYGYDLGCNRPVKIGTPVGILAAQSIGEPGTQLTLRTFHTGGVAGRDITQGLPRVEELFEVRPIKSKAVLAEHSGKVKLVEENEHKKLSIKYRDVKKESYILPEDDEWNLKVKNGDEVLVKEILAESGNKKIKSKHKGKIQIKDNLIEVIYEADDIEEYDVTDYNVWVEDGDKIERGQELTDGPLDLRELYSLRGRQDVEKYILKEIEYIYSSQGQKLNDKHVEVVVRQMFSRCLIEDGGDTNLLPGEVVPKSYLIECNDQAKAKGGQLAKGEEVLTGITRVSLSTDSWLSAASFQESSRILIDAAITGREDKLRGLKENVIIGRLIPAGTGLEARKK